MSELEPGVLVRSDREVADWIWDNLIPESGQAQWVQAEMLRAVERLRWEAQVNGNINWDDGFEMFIDYLADHLVGGLSDVDEETKRSISSDLERLRSFSAVDELEDAEDEEEVVENLPYVEDDLYDRLVGQVVDFCRRHPQLMAHHHNPHQDR
jgi:hypothetical protein